MLYLTLFLALFAGGDLRADTVWMKNGRVYRSVVSVFYGKRYILVFKSGRFRIVAGNKVRRVKIRRLNWAGKSVKACNRLEEARLAGINKVLEVRIAEMEQAGKERDEKIKQLEEQNRVQAQSKADWRRRYQDTAKALDTLRKDSGMSEFDKLRKIGKHTPLALIPGMGQFYKGRYSVGGYILWSHFMLIAADYSYRDRYTQASEDAEFYYNLLLFSGITSSSAVLLVNEVVSNEKEIARKKLASNRETLYFFGAILFLVNYLDGVYGWFGPNKVRPLSARSSNIQWGFSLLPEKQGLSWRGVVQMRF